MGVSLPYFRRIRSADSRLVRELNEQLVFDALKQAGALSISDISSRTGLSASSVKSILRGLIETNLALEVGEEASSGGRRPTLYNLNLDGRFVIAVELATDGARVGLCRLNGTIVDVRETSLTADDPESFCSALRESIESFLEAEQIPTAHIQGAGVSQRGLVDNAGRRHLADDRDAWKVRDYSAELRQQLPFPVFFLDDGATRLAAEMERGAAIARENGLFVEIWNPQGRGVTGGIVSTNLISTGHHGFAGKFGKVIVDPAGMLDPDAGSNSWEDSGTLAALRREILGIDPGHDVSTVASAGSFFAIHRDDGMHEVLLERFVGIHAQAVKSLVQILDPSIVIIGGTLLDLGPQVVDALRSRILGPELGPYLDGLTVEVSRLQSDGALLGASAYVLQHVVNLSQNRGDYGDSESTERRLQHQVWASTIPGARPGYKNNTR